MNAIVPVILSGGSGTRLWPLSRTMYPKQFIRFFDGQTSSFLAATLKRLPRRGGLRRAHHRVQQRSPLPGRRRRPQRAGVTPSAIVLEPLARNTAPAAAVAALMVAREDPAGILALMPSDHVIEDEPGFVAAVRRAAEVARTGKLVLFGITPNAPHTGYGYIRRGAPLAGFAGAYAVDAFTEKPDAQTAAAYLEAGTYSWNSGIFVFGARAFLEELARLEPAILDAARQALAEAREDLGFLRLGQEAFARAPATSIDYAVMERTERGRRAAGRHRLERCRLLVVAVGAEHRTTRTATRCRATRCWKPRPAPTSIPSARWSPRSASRTSSSSTRPMRCSWPTAPGPRRCPASSRA